MDAPATLGGVGRPHYPDLPRAVGAVAHRLGCRVPALLAAIPASLGALLITLVTFSQLALWPSTDTTRFPLMGVAYAPALAWGLFLAIITVSYVVRRRRSN